MEEQTDLRKDSRYQARDGSVAILRSDTSTKLGLITDISHGGLAFCYLDLEHEEDFKSLLNVNIFREADGFSLFNVPCKIIMNNNSSYKKSIVLGPLRKCSVQFVELTSDKISQLEYFIENFTKDSSSESSKIATDQFFNFISRSKGECLK